MSNQTLSLKRKQFLHDIGLSHDAIALYSFLLAQRILTANAASLELNTHSSAIYRLFYRLESLGLARRLDGRPMSFEAIPKAEGLATARKQYDQHLARLLQMQSGSYSADAEMIIGSKAIYERYESLSNKANQQIQIYSIGMAFSEELYKLQSSVISRGVTIKHLVQRLRPASRPGVTKFKRLGVDVRQNPAEKGFHFMIFDDKAVLASFSDPHDTTKHLSFVAENHAAVLLFESQFNELWATAKQIK